MGIMPNQSAWRASAYAPDLSKPVTDFARGIWPEAEIADAQYHRWQYQENPAGPALAALAQEEPTGRVIGQFGAIPVRVVMDGEQRLAALALNVATDAEYRRQGMFAKLGATSDKLMAQAGVALAFAMPNQNSFPGFLSRLGYSAAGDIAFLVRPVNALRLARSRVSMPILHDALAVAARPFVPPLPAQPLDVIGVEVGQVIQFDEAFDDLWKRLRNRHRVMTIRDASYLEWRYLRIPLREYHCFAAIVAGELAGYIVLRLASMLGLNGGLVVDFVTEASERGRRAGAALLSHALAFFADEDVDLLAALMLPHAHEYVLLQKARFRPLPKLLLPQPFRLVARGPAPTLSAKNWFFTFGDYDVV